MWGMSEFIPEKWIWSDADFSQMGWHDVIIHSILIKGGSIAFDIDYMFKWAHPAPGETYYKFWMSPASLIFDNVEDLKLAMNSQSSAIIMGVVRSEAPSTAGGSTTSIWRFECEDGEIAFRGSGYRQFIRRRPVLSSKQYFTEGERGESSFSSVTP
jgi:hypothetical protein